LAAGVVADAGRACYSVHPGSKIAINRPRHQSLLTSQRSLNGFKIVFLVKKFQGALPESSCFRRYSRGNCLRL